jgi:hypothetical protein
MRARYAAREGRRSVSETASDNSTPDPTPSEPPSSETPLDAAWRELVSKWNEPAAHKAFVTLAAQLDALQDAARRYREAKSEDDAVVIDGYRVPGSVESRREIAEKGLQLVLAQALARFDSMPREDRRSRGAVVMPIAALMMLFALSFALANMTHNRTFVSLPSLAVQVLIVAIIPWQKLQR